MAHALCVLSLALGHLAALPQESEGSRTNSMLLNGPWEFARGDGTEGDIVSQNAALTAKIIDWILEVGSPDIPKLFKLTGAVTSIYPILAAIKGVFDRYPGKKAERISVLKELQTNTMTKRIRAPEAWSSHR